MIKNDLPPTTLLKSDFTYDLPPQLIAQTPATPRDSSRMLTVDRQTGALDHKVFRDVVDYLNDGDVLVVNDSKVIPARLYGRKLDTGVKVEVLLLRQRSPDSWEVILKPGRRCKVGTDIVFGDMLSATIVEQLDDGNRILRFDKTLAELYAAFDKIGNVPLPPYITQKLDDPTRYQTVYAREKGSAAAPTAGLHFTEELLERIKAKGVKIAPVMLHVGLGTFRPVKEEQITDHVMHSEYFEVTPESAEIINNRRGRLIAVGTTSCRTIESAADENGRVIPMSGDTGIFIYPGYKFKAVEGLITNFHLPESTLLMLVSAFSSRDIMLNAYKTAVEHEYRFFSFGDAMLIL